MTLSCALINGAWLGAQVPEYQRFRRALRDPRAAQEALLRGYLRAGAGTVFGALHGFAQIRDATQFQQRLPLTSYDEMEPLVARIARGERGVLTREDVRRLQPSSGSTRAAKLIPYTRSLQREFARGVAPWLVELARQVPGILGGPAYWSITPQVDLFERAAPHGPPVGFESDAEYLGGAAAWLTARVLVRCDDLRRVSDMHEFRRRTLLRLLRARGLRLISVWHPTFLELLLRHLLENWDALLADLGAGVAALPGVHAEPRAAARARELRGVDPRELRAIWPRLAVVSCWRHGHAAALSRELQARLHGLMVQPKGLIATEAFVSLPFGSAHPLAIRSHVFEFIDSAGVARFCWDVEPGAEYSVAVTTGGGLYRYRLHDRVLVNGMLGSTPCLSFIGKEDSIVDLRGEKLSEGFVAAALAKLLPRLSPEPGFAMLAPEEGDPPGYTLYLETAQEPPAELREQLQAALCANAHYAHCVRLGQLRPATVVRTGARAAERYLERMRRTGRRLGDIKPAALSPLRGWTEELR